MIQSMIYGPDQRPEFVSYGNSDFVGVHVESTTGLSVATDLPPRRRSAITVVGDMVHAILDKDPYPWSGLRSGLRIDSQTSAEAPAEKKPSSK